MKKMLLLALVLTSFIACKYSMKGISIDPDAKTFTTSTFEIKATNAPPTLGQTFRDDLINKVRNESRLRFVDDKADIEFIGAITQYRVSAVAPQAGEVTEYNRLDVTIQLEYFNHLDEEDTWTHNFSYFYDFESSTNLLDIQDTAIEVINEQLLEDIFNKAFTNW